jgi:tetratricopeptide (TPR) repeat protein
VEIIPENNKKAIEVFSKLMEQTSICLVSQNNKTKESLIQLLRLSNCSPKLFLQAKDLDKAKEKMQGQETQVFIYDYEGNQEELQSLRERVVSDQNINMQIIIISKTLNQNLVNHCVEQGIDNYLIKPVNFDTLMRSLMSSIRLFHSNSEYFEAVYKGIKLKGKGKNAKAGECFKKAIGINPKASLGYYYLGACLNADKQNEMAVKIYMKSLASNKYHYPSILDISNVFFSMNEYSEPMKLWNRLNHVALGGDLLKDWIKASLNANQEELAKKMLKNYLDSTDRNYDSDAIIVEDLYLKGVEEKDKVGKLEKGNYFLESAISLCLQKKKFKQLPDIIKLYVDEFQDKNTFQLMELFKGSIQNNKLFPLIELMITEKKEEPNMASQKAIQFLDRGITHPYIFELALKLETDKADEKSKLSKIKTQAMEKFPEYSEFFEKLVA